MQKKMSVIVYDCRWLAVIVLSFLLLAGCNRKPNDQLIVEQIEAKLFQDSALKKCDIHVASANGVVTLTGSVDNKGEELAAANLAQQVKGVRQVIVTLDVTAAHLDDKTNSLQPTPQADGTPPQPPPAKTSDTVKTIDTKPADTTAEVPAAIVNISYDDPIDRYLSQKPNSKLRSPLTGNGSVFESNGRQYTIDPRLIVAISGAETSFAAGKCRHTPVSDTRNAWNWFYCYGKQSCGTDPCVNSPFDTWGSGIKTVSKYVERNYVMKGLTDVRKIQTKYCIDGCDYWVKNVDFFMREMGGDPENLSVADPYPPH